MIHVRVYLDNRSRKQDGTSPVKIGVTHMGRDFLVSTGVSCRPENWSDGSVARGEPNYKTKNSLLHNKVNQINLLLLDLERKGLNPSLSRLKQMIKNELNGESKNDLTLIDVLDEHVKFKTKKNTIESYQQTRAKITDAGMNISINDISVKWLRGFELYLKNIPVSVNSIALHMRNIRAVNNYAIESEYTNAYPFRKFRIKKEDTEKRSLTIAQLQAFLSYDCEPHMIRYRDYFFLTIFLCGINLADLVEIKEIRDERIEYHRSKTDKLYSIKVEPEAMEIINRNKGNRYLVNIKETYSDYRSFNSKLNKMLKRFGPVETVNKKGKKQYKPLFQKLSIYWARHTWATIAAELGVSDEVISQALGHSTANPTTAIYINRNRDKIDEANRRVIDAVMSNV